MKTKFIVYIATIFLANKTAHANGNIMNAASSAAAGVMIYSSIENTAEGKKFLGKCGTGTWVYCAAAGLAFAQAATSLMGAKDAKKTGDATQCYGSFCGSSDDQGTSGPNLPGTTVGGTLPGGQIIDDNTLGNIQDEINQSIDDLRNRGYSYDPSTNSVKTPNGNVSASSLNSSSGLKSLGASDTVANDILGSQKNTLAKIKSLADKYASGDFEGGGGSKIKPGPGYDKDKNDFDMNQYLASLMKKKDAPRGVAGLEKKYGSDQIGVAQDDIFKMIHRRYEAKKASLNH